MQDGFDFSIIYLRLNLSLCSLYLRGSLILCCLEGFSLAELRLLGCDLRVMGSKYGNTLPGW